MFRDIIGSTKILHLTTETNLTKQQTLSKYFFWTLYLSIFYIHIQNKPALYFLTYNYCFKEQCNLNFNTLIDKLKTDCTQSPSLKRLPLFFSP